MAKLYPDEEVVQLWLAVCQRMINEHYADHFPNLPFPSFDTQAGSRYIRVVSCHPDSQDVVFAFIVREDFETKTMGALKKGDVLKPATWKAPAKHARGNIYNTNTRAYMTPYGPHYLR